MSRYLRIVLFALVSTIPTSLRAQQPELELSVSPSNAVTLQPGVGSVVTERGDKRTFLSVRGEEDVASCEPYGRRSVATGSADITLVAATASSITYSMETSATAAGGHYRTGACLNLPGGQKKLAFFSGNDTRATVRA